jgi:hypothetical protein
MDLTGGIGWWFGSSTEAAMYIKTPANLGAALTRSDAAEWVNLMRLNTIGKSNRTCAQQPGEEACTFSLWTKRSPEGAAAR